MKKFVLRFTFFSFMAGALFFTACNKGDEQVPEETSGLDIEKLNIPSEFDYATSYDLTINITDEDGVKYDIYSLKSKEPDEIQYSDQDTVIVMDDMNTKVISGVVKNGSLNVQVSVPSYHKYLYLVRSLNGSYDYEYLPVDGNGTVEYHPSGLKRSAVANHGGKVASDVIFMVNRFNNDLATIDMSTHDLSVIDQIPFTSLATGIDPVNGRVYIANRKAPYELGYYEIATGNFVVVGHLITAIPRMDYNENDGLLYLSKENKLYKVNPANGQYLQSFTIHGITDPSWGDLAFASDGTLYILSRSGVYKCTINGTNVYATEVSDNTLSDKLTSIAVGSNGMIYLTTKEINNQIIELDPTTAAWNYIAVNGTGYANDFAILRPVVNNDADGDGVPDGQDEYPNDPDRAFNNYFPGQGLWATLAFEDLWPAKGDYDFNDMVTRYNINQVTNAQNKVVDVIATYDVKHNGAGLHNGFAFQIPVDQANVASVTTDYQSLGIIPLNGNGTIAGQDKANFLVFEDNDVVVGNQIHLTVHFNTPVATTETGTPPYNVYLMKDCVQSEEIHLPDSAPTQLADQSLFGTDDDTSDPAIGRYYKTEKNLPWAINIVYDFEWMKEKVEIVHGYLHFAEWAESGGTVYQDWYKDLPGYRDESVIDN